jgi:hypothetical protein
MMDSEEASTLAAILLSRCDEQGCSPKESMKVLIMAAGLAAEMETMMTNECQKQEFVDVCNFALEEYKHYSDSSDSAQNAPTTKVLQ